MVCLFDRTTGGDRVLEVGCGRDVGVEVLLDRLGAAHVTAFDLDPSMVELARRRLRDRPAEAVSLSVGDLSAIELPAGGVDAVVDFGIIHHVPAWRSALAEEFADELARHGLHGTGRLERHVGGMVFVGAARKAN